MEKLSESMKEAMERQSELAGLCRISGDCILLKCGSTDYEIALDRCATPAAINAWTVHLCGKSWMRLDVLRAFILAASRHHGLQVSL